MESIKEEPEDFRPNSPMSSDIEQSPTRAEAGALVVRNPDNYSESDASGETVEQSSADDMSLGELEECSDLLDDDFLGERDSDAQSEASTVILGDFEANPSTVGTQDVAMPDAPLLSPSIKNEPDSDSDEENQFALTPSPSGNTPGSSTAPYHTVIDSQASPCRPDECMACQEGRRIEFFGYCGPCAFKAGRWRVCNVCQRLLPSVGWRGLCFDCVPMTESERDYIWAPNTESIAELLGHTTMHTCLRCGNDKPFEKTYEEVGSSINTLNGGLFGAGDDGQFGQPAYNMTTEPMFPSNIPHWAQVPPLQAPFVPAPFPLAQFPYPPAPMFPSQQAQVPVDQMNLFPHPGNPQPHPGNLSLTPPVYSQYVAVPLQPMFQPVYQPPIQHFGGPYPPYATDRWNYDLPDTNAQRAAATEYPVRAQTPHPPRYLPRNGSGFEYAGMAAQTPERGQSSFMPGSANRATTGSPREGGRVESGPFESAHSYNFGRQ
ncbi:hypothetical protein CEP54_005392 [Fusarium duplospermum]|uniref:Uncharacterized protein n=1 Tax=Fusarium duplospermum TaxID=1325734 RepID=A0A428QCP4_9HYPO|nr:hypothetical protein CEP54_005392 [Fusarium duplospermum]